MIDVVAAVIEKDNKYLIAQRNRNKHFAYHWEFPGGKVNDDESFENALEREINEELSINIKIIKKITNILLLNVIEINILHIIGNFQVAK